MKSDARWLGILAVRVLANALMGGVSFAIAGAFYGFIVGGLYAGLSFDFEADSVAVGGMIGGSVGAASGLVGALIYAIAACRAAPGELLAPFNRLCKGVCLGQLGGVMLACASFLVCSLIGAALQNVTLVKVLTGDGSLLFIAAAPAAMICGAIAGALWKSTNTVAAPEAR